MAFSVDSTLKSLMDDEKAKEVLLKHFGDRTNDSRVYEVMYESLRSISYYPEAGISKELLEAVDADLKKL